MRSSPIDVSLLPPAACSLSSRIYIVNATRWALRCQPYSVLCCCHRSVNCLGDIILHNRRCKAKSGTYRHLVPYVCRVFSDGGIVLPSLRSASRVILFPLFLLPLSGCLVRSRDGDHGGKDVDIATPLGGLSVKTDNAAVQRKLGLPLYSGAIPEQKKGDDNSSADVDMNFGAFHLRVLAMSFTSADSPEKVRAFYRTALAQYSDVIECRHHNPVGKPERTGLGLTCADDNHVHTGKNHDLDPDSAGETELKSGSKSRQHIVSFQAAGSGTKFGLVSLELPRGDDSGA